MRTMCACAIYSIRTPLELFAMTSQYPSNPQRPEHNQYGQYGQSGSGYPQYNGAANHQQPAHHQQPAQRKANIP